MDAMQYKSHVRRKGDETTEGTAALGRGRGMRDGPGHRLPRGTRRGLIDAADDRRGGQRCMSRRAACAVARTAGLQAGPVSGDGTLALDYNSASHRRRTRTTQLTARSTRRREQETRAQRGAGLRSRGLACRDGGAATSSGWSGACERRRGR